MSRTSARLADQERGTGKATLDSINHEFRTGPRFPRSTSCHINERPPVGLGRTLCEAGSRMLKAVSGGDAGTWTGQVIPRITRTPPRIDRPRPQARDPRFNPC